MNADRDRALAIAPELRERWHSLIRAHDPIRIGGRVVSEPLELPLGDASGVLVEVVQAGESRGPSTFQGDSGSAAGRQSSGANA